jgi:manganese-dependent inorganic pyrophosphatase
MQAKFTPKEKKFMDKVYIIGHKNPDTDSICSAISYCELKKALGVTNCVAGRLGSINKETEFALNYFDVAPPILIESVKTQISDIDYDNTNLLYPYMTIKQVWETMKITQNKMLPIIENLEDKRMKGIISLGDVTRFNMETFDENTLAKYETTFANIAEVLGAEVLMGNGQLSDIVKGKVVSFTGKNAIHSLDSNSVVIASEDADIDKIAMFNVKCIILTDGFQVVPPKGFDGIMLSTKETLFCVIRNIGLAVSVRQVMEQKDIISFNEKDFVEDIRDVMIKLKYRNFPVLDSDKNVLGTISGRHLMEVKNKKVIVVDHNERSQSVDGLEQAHILEIVDHHRVGDIQTNYPILFRNEPVGSTATIVAAMYKENDIVPEKKIAGILLSAILSDTLLFKSPTCTEMDKLMAKRMAEIAEIHIEHYGKQLLNIGINIEGKTPKELFDIDYKEFEYNKYRLVVSQVNAASEEGIKNIKGMMLPYIKKIAKEKAYNIVMFIITDILNGGSEIIYAGDAKQIVKELYHSTSNETTGYLPGVISRKKQVMPQLLNKLSYY